MLLLGIVHLFILSLLMVKKMPLDLIAANSTKILELIVESKSNWHLSPQINKYNINIVVCCGVRGRALASHTSVRTPVRR